MVLKTTRVSSGSSMDFPTPSHWVSSAMSCITGFLFGEVTRTQRQGARGGSNLVTSESENNSHSKRRGEAMCRLPFRFAMKIELSVWSMIYLC